MEVKGWTLEELATILEIEEGAVQMRLHRAGIKPLITKAVYPKSALEAIRDVPVQGQHRKKPAPEASKKPRKNPKQG